MAVQTVRRSEYVGELNGDHGSMLSFPEAATQTFKCGDLVYLASGKVTVCPDNGVTIMGVAATDATGTTDTAINVVVLTPSSILSLSVYNSTAASAITAVAQVGLKYPIENVSDVIRIDNSDQTTPSLVVIGIDKRDNMVVGDQYGRYLCTVMSACLQTAIGA